MTGKPNGCVEQKIGYFFGVPLGTICGGNGKLVASKNLNENLDEGGFFTMMVVVNQYWIGSDF